MGLFSRSKEPLPVYTVPGQSAQQPPTPQPPAHLYQPPAGPSQEAEEIYEALRTIYAKLVQIEAIVAEIKPVNVVVRGEVGPAEKR